VRPRPIRTAPTAGTTSTRSNSGPAFAGYFADPFVLRLDDGYIAVGTGTITGDRVFALLSSPDLVAWSTGSAALVRPPDSLGDEYWAPEIAFSEGRYWLYYSVGHGIAGHHVRVASSIDPLGPYTDLGVDLTPGEDFAIDPHPFRDDDGRWYLYFARDVLDDPRPGTQLAVASLDSMTAIGEVLPALAPYADWQLYESRRAMYGSTYEWHTLEGPSVVRRRGRYWMTYSGGAWTGEGYGVAWAVADDPLGPWTPSPPQAPLLLRTSENGYRGPGHNSLTTAPDGRDVIVFHAWNGDLTLRQMYLHYIEFEDDGPVLGAALPSRS
jgi:GH43 family beta-xylosidase